MVGVLSSAARRVAGRESVMGVGRGGGKVGVSRGGGRLGGVSIVSKEYHEGTEVWCVFLRKVAVR